MWHYSNAQRFRPPVPPPPPGPQSTHDLVMSLRGMAVSFLFLDLNEPERPVTQVPGFIEEVSAASITIGLAAPLPRLAPSTRFGVEVLAGSGILRFHSTAHRPAAEGDTRVEITLPRQIESVQRRKFSRAQTSLSVVFTRSLSQGSGEPEVNGLGQALDLGAGGLRLVTQTPLRHGQHLFMSFSTPDGLTYRGIEAKVVRVQFDDGRYTAAIQFSNLSTQVESDLVQTVFRLQLRNPARR